MLLPILLALPCLAQATEYTDRTVWEAAVGAISTAPFTGYAGGTIITTQYQSIGMTYTQGDDTVLLSGDFPTDGAGVACNGNMEIKFSSPIHAIGIDFPGALEIDLYLGNTLVYLSGHFAGSGTGLFAGIVTTGIFDRAIIGDWLDQAAYVDNVSSASGGPTLSKTGICPGPMSLFLTDCTPNSPVAILHGPAGSFTQHGNPCTGLQLGISNPTLAAMLGANGAGNASLTFNAPPGACGRTVQAVDVASCTPTNTLIL